jgi:hypothetical protein
MAGQDAAEPQPYDVYKSGFLQLDTPITGWCAARRRCWRRARGRKQGWPWARRRRLRAGHQPLVPGTPLRREAFKLVVLMPLVPVRIAVIIVAAAYMAILNSLLTIGW